MVRYADSSYAGDIDDRKLITRYCFFFGGGIVTWYSKQQHIISTFTSKTKYVAISHRARESIWIQRLLNKLLPEQAIKKIEILGDNKMSFTLTKDSKSQNRTKYIDIIYHHIQWLMADRKLGIKWIFSSLILANGLTKALPTGFFKRYWDKLGLVKWEKLKSFWEPKLIEQRREF